jgi:hypothetical protein
LVVLPAGHLQYFLRHVLCKHGHFVVFKTCMVRQGDICAQVQNARHKLDGRHPSAILIAELTPKHSGTKHWAALQVLSFGMSEPALLPNAAASQRTTP